MEGARARERTRLARAVQAAAHDPSALSSRFRFLLSARTRQELDDWHRRAKQLLVDASPITWNGWLRAQRDRYDRDHAARQTPLPDEGELGRLLRLGDADAAQREAAARRAASLQAPQHRAPRGPHSSS